MKPTLEQVKWLFDKLEEYKGFAETEQKVKEGIQYFLKWIEEEAKEK